MSEIHGPVAVQTSPETEHSVSAGDSVVSEDAPARVCGAGAPTPILEDSRIIRYSGAGWDEVRVQPYKAEDGAFAGIFRRVLAAPATAAFELRYFEIEPDGYSSWERHAHVHVVVCHRGRGRVCLGDAVHEVGYGDIVYVAPNEPHQFLNPYGEPFGFLCIVDRERDRPVPIGGERADA